VIRKCYCRAESHDHTPHTPFIALYCNFYLWCLVTLALTDDKLEETISVENAFKTYNL